MMDQMNQNHPLNLDWDWGKKLGDGSEDAIDSSSFSSFFLSFSTIFLLPFFSLLPFFFPLEKKVRQNLIFSVFEWGSKNKRIGIEV